MLSPIGNGLYQPLINLVCMALVFLCPPLVSLGFSLCCTYIPSVSYWYVEVFIHNTHLVTSPPPKVSKVPKVRYSADSSLSIH